MLRSGTIYTLKWKFNYSTKAPRPLIDEMWTVYSISQNSSQLKLQLGFRLCGSVIGNVMVGVKKNVERLLVDCQFNFWPK